MSFMKLIT